MTNRTVSSAKSFAALLNFMACTVNVALAWWLYNDGSSFYVINIVCAAFSGTLALGNFFGYLEARDKKERDEIYRRISGRY